MHEIAMIVDDSKIDILLTNRVLEKQHFAKKIIIYESPVTALAYLSSVLVPDHFPNVIFLDIRMPDMSGFDFLDQYALLREDLRSGCDVVMISTSDLAEDSRRAKSYPSVRSFIVKPLTKDKLAQLSSLL